MNKSNTCCAKDENLRETSPVLGYFTRVLSAFENAAYFFQDARGILKRDPAINKKALGFMEVPLYASFWALFFYRLAHPLNEMRVPFFPRLLSQFARLLTGIEIHPGAILGPGLFIDHGMGVVVGETAIVGRDVTLFHGVTLGGVDGRPGRRHPCLGDGVIVGAGAKILGPIRIGDNVTIGAQAVVLSDIQSGCTAVGIPARVLAKPRLDAVRLIPSVGVRLTIKDVNAHLLQPRTDVLTTDVSRLRSALETPKPKKAICAHGAPKRGPL